MATVEYQLTKRELILTGTIRQLGRTRTLVMLGLRLIIAIMLILIGDPYSIIGWVFLASVFLSPLLFARAIQRFVNANPLLTSKFTMDFGDVGIISVSEGYRSEREWRSFFGWSHSDKYFFLRADKLGTAITIPKRAFTEVQLELFFDQLSHIDGKLLSLTNET
jgi:YcxB-like protein